MAGTVDLEVADAVATITFDNREKRNALGPPLINDIIGMLDEVEERDDVRCLVLTGAGEKAFSSGFDISYHQRNYGEGPEVTEEEISTSSLPSASPAVAASLGMRSLACIS